MSGPGTAPLFVDTGAFFAYYYERAGRHETARETFDAIRRGELAYRPLYTSRYVLAELATLLVRKADHATAVRALEEIRAATGFRVLSVDEPAFDTACEEFARYDDQEISLVDHLSAVLAAERGVEHVFTFDRRDFSILGVTVVPHEIE